MEAIPGLKFSSVERHTLPALCNGFSREYKKEWMESFKNHLQQYDVSKLERIGVKFTDMKSTIEDTVASLKAHGFYTASCSE